MVTMQKVLKKGEMSVKCDRHVFVQRFTDVGNFSVSHNWSFSVQFRSSQHKSSITNKYTVCMCTVHDIGKIWIYVGEFVSFTGSGVIVLRTTFEFHFHTNSLINLLTDSFSQSLMQNCRWYRCSCNSIPTPVIFRVWDWKHNSFGFHHHFQ